MRPLCDSKSYVLGLTDHISVEKTTHRIESTADHWEKTAYHLKLLQITWNYRADNLKKTTDHIGITAQHWEKTADHLTRQQITWKW